MIRKLLASVLLLGAVFTTAAPAHASDCPPYVPEVLQPVWPFC